MQKSLSQIAFMVGIVTLGLTPVAYAERDSGGGDLCEARIQEVGNDIEAWIRQGGASGLKLPTGVDDQVYSKTMLESLDRAKVKCVGAGDSGFPVEINGTAKVCRFDRSLSGETRVTCDTNKFHAMSESDQYVLVHHEYAGLAGLELPNQDDSDYGISYQISGYLTDVVVKKLAVKPQQESSRYLYRVDCGEDFRFSISREKRIISFLNIDVLKPLFFIVGAYGYDSEDRKTFDVEYDSEKLYSATHLTLNFPKPINDFEGVETFTLEVEYSDSEGMSTQLSGPVKLRCILH